jgi:hypothetical protein
VVVVEPNRQDVPDAFNARVRRSDDADAISRRGREAMAPPGSHYALNVRDDHIAKLGG